MPNEHQPEAGQSEGLLPSLFWFQSLSSHLPISPSSLYPSGTGVRFGQLWWEVLDSVVRTLWCWLKNHLAGLGGTSPVVVLLAAPSQHFVGSRQLPLMAL